MTVHQDSTTTTRSMTIVVGTANTSSSSNSSGVAVAVWICQERVRHAVEDRYKYHLEYFEFVDDTVRWAHLDQLLLRYSPQTLTLLTSSSIHHQVDGMGSAKKKDKKSSGVTSQREQRLLQQLQDFLEGWIADDEANACQLQLLPLASAVDTAKLESTISQLLLQDSAVQLAYRGNLELSQNKLLQQGLLGWMQTERVVPTVPDDWQHSLKLQPGVLTSHLVMDRTAAACIHLLPPANAGVATVVGGNSHNNSLYGLLSQPCSTVAGKAKLQVWLRQPLIDLESILFRQHAVTALLQGTGKDAMKEALAGFSGVDLSQLANTLAHYSTTAETKASISTTKALKALYQLYILATTQLPQLVEAMESFDVEGSELLQQFKIQASQLLAELARCQGLVETVLDLDLAPREYLLKPEYSEELQGMYQEIQELQQQVDQELVEMQERWEQASNDATPVRLETCTVQNNDGSSTSSWQFRLPNTNASKILTPLSGIKLHRVLKNGVYFSTTTLRGLSANHQQLTEEYSKHSQQVVQDAMEVAVTYQIVVERACQMVATLDVLTALARVAAYNPHGYCKPTLTDSDAIGHGIELKEARHPCVELQDDMEFIPNDVNLKLGPDNNFLLVTGPNMGGKSTYIRALGAIVCLAQIGAYVPATQAKINICHSLLARVGAGDLQERGISTFMAEMLEASSILRTATNRSLIIIDELGRGTSTFDGYGLARAISEYLQNRVGCLTVFATHFHELTHMPGVQNCHVTAQQTESGLTFLYHVKPGPCLESFGIQVAEMANVPSVVIQDAKRKAAELEDFGSSTSLSTSSSNSTKRRQASFRERFCAMDLPRLLAEHGRSAATGTKVLEMLGQ